MTLAKKSSLLSASPLCRGALLLVCALVAASASALDFRSVATDRAILYDAPSPQATKLFVASRYYPLEVIVNLGPWLKIRDRTGGLVWIEKKDLSEARTVVVTAERADIRQAPDKDKPLVFQAERDVALELVKATGTGWAEVRHRDGQSGYVQVNQVWGL